MIRTGTSHLPKLQETTKERTLLRQQMSTVSTGFFLFLLSGFRLIEPHPTISFLPGKTVRGALLQVFQTSFPGFIRLFARRFYASMLAYVAFCSINWRLGSTSSPISIEKISSASAAFSIVTCFKRRVSGFIVVSQSCSGFISPRPL